MVQHPDGQWQVLPCNFKRKYIGSSNSLSNFQWYIYICMYVGLILDFAELMFNFVDLMLFEVDLIFDWSWTILSWYLTVLFVELMFDRVVWWVGVWSWLDIWLKLDNFELFWVDVWPCCSLSWYLTVLFVELVFDDSALILAVEWMVDAFLYAEIMLEFVVLVCVSYWVQFWIDIWTYSVDVWLCWVNVWCCVYKFVFDHIELMFDWSWFDVKLMCWADTYGRALRPRESFNLSF